MTSDRNLMLKARVLELLLVKAYNKPLLNTYPSDTESDPFVIGDLTPSVNQISFSRGQLLMVIALK